MEQEILHVHFVPSLSDGTVEPSCPQYAGVQGDRNAALVSFLVPTTLRGAAFRYRIEGVDGAGGYISTAPLTMDDEYTVATLLDERFTAAGGQILVRLVVSELSGDNEVATVHSFDGRLFFADAPQDNVSSAFRDTLSAMVVRTDEKLKEMDELADELTEDVGEIAARATAVETALVGHGTRLTAAEGTIASQGTRLTAAEGTIAGQGTRLTAAEGTISSHGTRLTADEAALDELDEWAEDLSEKILELDGEKQDKEQEATPWQFLQKVVRLGLAEQLFSVGDTFSSEHAEYGNIVWEIVDFDHNTLTDDRFTHSITLQAVDCLHKTDGQYDLKVFDAPSTAYGNGCSDWEGSDLREWLNSDDAAGEWFCPQAEGDVAPAYGAQAGFMKGFSESFLSAIGTVETPVALNSTHQTRSGTVSDKFFLPSRVEVFAGKAPGGSNPNEGTVYEAYGADYSSLAAAGVGNDTNRVKELNGTATAWWTRSAHPMFSDTVMKTSTTGAVVTEKANTALAVLPMCCIY